MSVTVKVDAFLLTRGHWDEPGGLVVELWAASSGGAVRVLVEGQEAVFFVERGVSVRCDRRASVDLRLLGGGLVDAVYFGRQGGLVRERGRLRSSGVSVFESDIRPEDRFLMERFITGPVTISGAAVERSGFLEFRNPVLRPSSFVPCLSVASLDIETEGLDGRLYSVAVVTDASERVFMVGDGQDTDRVCFCSDEKSVLDAFLAHIREVDPDVIVGWNVVDFDLRFLARVCERTGTPFALGRIGEKAYIPESGPYGNVVMARVPGRVVLDGIACLRGAMHRFESFSLESVARQVLGKGKLIHPTGRVGEITRLYHEAPLDLAAYNLEDCRLVLEIFKRTHLLEFEVERARLNGLTLGRQRGSVAAFDFLYLPKLHRGGFVAPDASPDRETRTNPGGYVMESTPGLHSNVLVLDFKSLYPSIIKTFHIDPLAMAESGQNPIPGFRGGSFSRDRHLLPGILTELWAARDEAKKAKNQPLSQAIKILMNSFYGVLGTPNCRFYSPPLASSITLYGQRIIKRTKHLIEAQGYQVVYGDTDSVFVLLGDGYDEENSRRVGEELAAHLNRWWCTHLENAMGLPSFLEIEFETLFLQFFMPTIRGTNRGSKKRYAGMVRDQDGKMKMVFKGLEVVRTDWTPLARGFQKEVYRLVFLGRPFDDYIHETVRCLREGKLDEKLVYRKQLRKPVSEYTKNIPPHVRAARQLDHPEQWVSYVITVNGPQPVEKLSASPDYEHYVKRQLAPVADSILSLLGTSTARILDPQLELFPQT